MRFLKFNYEFPYQKCLEEVELNKDLWDVFTLRQDMEGTAHSDTKCIPLRGPDIKVGVDLDEEIKAYYTNFSDYFPVVLSELEYMLENMPELELGRVMLVSLKPGGHISRHKDTGSYAEYYRRIHIPLKSQEGNIFISDQESIHMIPGEVYMFNHLIEHEVFNNSNEERIHLIVDFRTKGS